MALSAPAANCCSYSYTNLRRLGIFTWRPPRRAAVRAQEGERASSAGQDEESRLEAFEASVKSKKGAKAAQEGLSQGRSTQPVGSVEWKEGSLLPERWEEMDPLEKASSLYMGKYGALYWANKLAWTAIIGVGGLWVLFRFLLPALGLLHWADEVAPPNF